MKTNKITYLGIDETSLGIGNNSSIVVATETQNPTLIKDMGIKSLQKSKDLLRESVLLNSPPKFPSYKQMQKAGVKNFHWTRAKGGRFSLKKLQHATIAHVVQINGYKPQSTVIYIDAFYANYQKSQYLIHEYLCRRNFKIPLQNIIICGSGDQCIPIINYADILAFQIGLNLNEIHKKHNPGHIPFPFKPLEIPFDEQRIMIPLDQKGREMLEDVLKSW